MKRNTKRWLAGFAGIMGVGFVGLNVLAYNHAKAMTHFTADGSRTSKPEALGSLQKAKILLTGVNMPRPIGERTPSALAPDCLPLEIDAPDHVTLHAWYCDRGKSTPLVILFYGYSSEKTSLLGEARVFLDLGMSVMLVDFRGSGDSSESYTTIGVREADDVAAVVHYAEQNHSHSSVVLFGQSMGAVAILRAMQRHDVKPDAVILEAVFDTMLNTVRNRFHAMQVPSFPSAELLVFWGGQQCGFNGFRHNPVDYAASVHCRVLFMHGRNDPRARLDEGRRVFDAIPGPKEFVTFEETGHESYLAMHPAMWQAAVERTLRENGMLQETAPAEPISQP